MGEPLPRYGAGVTLRVWYEGPVPVSTVLTRSKRPEGERFLAQQTRPGDDGKEKYLNTRFLPATAPKGRLRMVRAGSEVRFLVAEGGDDQEIQRLNIGSTDVHKVQLVCNTQYTPVALDVCFTDLDLRADRILGSWIEPEPRPGQPRLAFDLRTPVEQLSPLSLFGPVTASTVATDAGGLHLTLPAGRQDTNPVGLELTKRLTGDFDISFGYELLAGGGPLHKYGSGLELRIWLDAPTPQGALLLRTRRPDGDRFVTLRFRKEPDGKEQYFDGKEVPATRPQGRLRLLRTGSRLHYLVSDGGDYRELQTLEIGTADVRLVQAQATTIRAPSLLEARFTDVKVQADQFQGGTPPPDREPVPASEESAVGLGPPRFILAVAAVVLTVAVGALYLWRRRRAPPPGGDAGA